MSLPLTFCSLELSHGPQLPIKWSGKCILLVMGSEKIENRFGTFALLESWYNVKRKNKNKSSLIHCTYKAFQIFSEGHISKFQKSIPFNTAIQLLNISSREIHTKEHI